MKIFLHYLAPALLLLSLPACKPSERTLHNLSAEERIFCEEESLSSEIRALVEHYLNTHEVNYATPEHGLTMLHLAAATQRFWLVEKLLAEGADPNVRMRQGEKRLPGDTPAILAVRAGQYGGSNRDALLIVRTLMAAGADINQRGHHDDNILAACENENEFRGIEQEKNSGEELMLELLKLGAEPDIENALHARNWPRAMEALLNSGAGDDIRAAIPELLYVQAWLFSGYDAEALASVRVLLEHADSVNERSDNGHTALWTLARKMLTTDPVEEAALRRQADFVIALLEKGADPLLPDGEFMESCAADFLAAHADMARLLSERHNHITPPPHHFDKETLVEQLLDIPTAAVRPAEAEAQYGLLATVLTAPTEAMRSYGNRYHEACAHALTLLHSVDAAHTRSLIMALPAWRDVSLWEGEVSAGRGLLYALMMNPQVILPKDCLLESARAMNAAGKPALAHAFIRLLARDKSAGALLEQLCAEDTPPAPACRRLELPTGAGRPPRPRGRAEMDLQAQRLGQ